MKISQAAVFETKKPDRARIVDGLKKAGIKVSAAQTVDALRRERLVVLGPSVTAPQKVAKALRNTVPEALVMAAMKRPKKGIKWADGVLPLPVSAPDLMVRLPELVELRLQRAKPAPARASKPKLVAIQEPVTMRPGEGILDPLTGFYTFAHFKEVLFIEVKRARRYNFPLSLALVSFDPLEDTLTDDLRAKLQSGLALAIRRSLRDTDFPVQYSADKVALLMPHTDLQGAMIVTRRITERVARATLQHGERVLHPTISAGVAAASHPSKEFSFAELVKHAQKALDAARGGGGNRVEFSTPDPGEFPTETQPIVAAGPMGD